MGPRPVVEYAGGADLLIGQASGTRVHEPGISWNDASGERLRDWLQMSADDFYNESKIAIVPMGFCYPGVDAKGDKPPRHECAPEWHPQLLAALPNVQLTLLIGQYAQRRYLAKSRKKTLTETVRHWRDYAPDYLPLPHQAERNNVWIKKNPLVHRRSAAGARQPGIRLIRLTSALPCSRRRTQNGDDFVN